MELAINETEIGLGESRLSVERLAEVGREYLFLQQIQRRLEARYAPIVLKGLRRAKELKNPELSTRESLNEWLVNFRSALEQVIGDDRQSPTIDLIYQSADSWSLLIRAVINGSLLTSRLEREFFKRRISPPQPTRSTLRRLGMRHL